VEGVSKMASSADSACSEKKRKASQSKLSSFFSLEKRQKGESSAAGEEVQSELSTSVNSKHRKSGFDPAWLKDFPWLESAINKDSRELLTALVQQTSLQYIFPNLHKLAVIALEIPMSSADCERGFSALKRIKTRLWNRLSNRILNHLLMISIEGPMLEEFDFEKAADIWGAQKNRRITVTS